MVPRHLQQHLRQAELPREIPGGVELTLADGDRLRIYASENYRTVWARRQATPATGTWGAPTVVLKRRNLSCGNVDARTANGAVAVIAQCDRYGYAEDQAPTSSRAIWSADTVTWSSYALDGEAYEEPGISPDGRNAVWPLHGRYVTSTAGALRRARPRHRRPGVHRHRDRHRQRAGLVPVRHLRGRPRARRRADADRRRPADPAGGPRVPTHAVTSTSPTSTPTRSGSATSRSPAHRAVISRADAASPWAVTQIPPAAAPGLERDGTGADFVRAPGIPLLAVSSRSRHRVTAQRYDLATQTWGPSTVAYDAGARRCSSGDNWLAEELGVIAVDLKCGGRHVVLTTPDGLTWRALRMGKHVRGLSADGRYVAVPGPSSTSIISAERGVVTLALPVTGRCDVVVPDGPDGAVLLTARGRHGGWPTVLQHSTPAGWSTLSRTTLPTYAPDCLRSARPPTSCPTASTSPAGWKGYTVQVVERDGTWAVRRSAY